MLPARGGGGQSRIRLLEAAPEQVERKYGILNAVRLPGVDPARAGVHDRSSLVKPSVT